MNENEENEWKINGVRVKLNAGPVNFYLYCSPIFQATVSLILPVGWIDFVNRIILPWVRYGTY